MREIIVDAESRHAWQAAALLVALGAATSWRPSWLLTADPTRAVWALNGEPQLPVMSQERWESS